MSMSHDGHAGHMPASGDRKALVISGWLTADGGTPVSDHPLTFQRLEGAE